MSINPASAVYGSSDLAAGYDPVSSSVPLLWWPFVAAALPFSSCTQAPALMQQQDCSRTCIGEYSLSGQMDPAAAHVTASDAIGIAACKNRGRARGRVAKHACMMLSHRSSRSSSPCDTPVSLYVSLMRVLSMISCKPVRQNQVQHVRGARDCGERDLARSGQGGQLRTEAMPRLQVMVMWELCDRGTGYQAPSSRLWGRAQHV